MSIVYNVGIYCRLSREDYKGGSKSDVSLSIENQQVMLENHVKKKGWFVYKVYVDDDFTGTNFDRPSFQEMMSDIQAHKIDCVITKDLSRLGRNYIEAGRHRELFADYGVRYIALHDNHDSANDGQNNITTPILEIMNENYAAEISRKVRYTKKLMAEQGKFANSRAPYGYLKSPDDKHKLVVDENVSHIIVRIYELYLSGTPARGIADIFNNEGIVTPNAYYYAQLGKPNPYKSNKNAWGSATIMNVLRNPAYYGAMSSGKRYAKSYKSKLLVCRPFDEWVIVEGTHEPIITKEQWEDAQRVGVKNRRETVRRGKNGEVSIFAGIIKCADCGANMVFNRNKNYEFYRCSTYQQKGKDACGHHKIRYDTLYNAVLANLQEYAVLAVEDEERLIKRILKANEDYNGKSVSRHERSLREANNRVNEIDGLLQSLFEDKCKGNVTDDMFKRMAAKYEDEQKQLTINIKQMEAELAEHQRTQQDVTGLIARIKDCLTIDALTRAVVVDLIDRIEVSEAYEIDGEKQFDLEIFYKFGLTNASSDLAKEKRAG